MYLGVDGGGSKTALVLIDRDGEVRATHLTSGAYYVTLGLDVLRAQLTEAIRAVLEKAAVRAEQVDFAFFGLPAHGEDASAMEQMDRLPEGRLRAGRYLCGNDMICGWAGSLGCGDGINVVAGTGSIAYGEREGATARCGGWGELFGDEGSAYWIACRGLDLFARMSDGRALRGPLYALMRERIGLIDDLELCGHVYVTLAGDRARIAQLCPLIFDAAAAGDSGAEAIITSAAAELALLVETARQRLSFYPDEAVAVSYSGGVFENAGPVFVEAFAKALRMRHPGYRLCEPQFSPVIGAALYAAKRNGTPLSAAALERLRSHRSEVQRELQS